MSSHHIVRDEQEPALIFMDGLDTVEDTGQLLEWSPLVVGTSRSINDLITLGIKIDIAIVDPKEVSHWQALLQYQQPIEIVTTTGETVKQLSDLINHLIKRKHQTFHILSKQLTFFDFIALFQTHHDKAELIYINETRKISVTKSGRYYKWLNKGEHVSVFPIEDRTYIRTNGFVENIDNELIQTELTFEAAQEGAVKIETNLLPLVISEGI